MRKIVGMFNGVFRKSHAIEAACLLALILLTFLVRPAMDSAPRKAIP
ncbi:MAG: hypothetical protein R2877_01715 [Bdellovibrionota bacterium]